MTTAHPAPDAGRTSGVVATDLARRLANCAYASLTDQENHVSRMQQVIAALEAERADVQERLDWLDRQIEEFRDHHDGEQATVPKRSTRRATARRASTRRAAGRRRQSDVQARVVEFLKDHPNSTAGDVAKGLNANRNTIATRLSQMVKAGDIKKASTGYAIK